MIFSRVKPKEITVKETYRYNANIISGKVEIKPTEKPEGKIEIIIPYSGKEHFTKQAVKDIEKQDADIWKNDSETHINIGYLVFLDYNDTDLDQRLELDVCNDAIAITIPVLNDKIKDKESLCDGRHECRRFQEYIPTLPDINPVDMRIEPFDDNIWEELRIDKFKRLTNIDESDTNDSEFDRYENTTKIFAQQEGFQRGLGFGIELTLFLPDDLHEKMFSTLPTLSNMEIQWPVTTSHHQITLYVQREEKEVHYVPDGQGTVKWDDVPFKVVKRKPEGSTLDEYSTPPMTLAVKQPGELYDKDSLKGELEISIPVALSGLHLHYFEANGNESEHEIEYSSKIQVKFELKELADSFKDRINVPYQHLQFEGVILDKMRIKDIENVLKDLGFGKLTRKLSFEGNTLNGSVITGKQKIGVEELFLGLVIFGSKTQTTRESEIPGGKKFTTDVETGHTTISMRGRLKGNNSSLIKIMNEFQSKLREQFRHVVAID
ncbi:MAG: hypothetical protein AAF702_34365 [Chloroflexota bacterium]